MSISIVNGRLIDPAHNIDDHLDLHIDGEQIVAIGDAPAEFTADDVIDAQGSVVCPGSGRSGGKSARARIRT